ncbi:MAG: hypothetical protein Q9214_003039, partial [Letrouitia sp. 1 TL-2023]
MSARTSNIPVIDFADWDQKPLEDKRATATQLVQGCRTVGFVYIINHKISTDQIKAAFSWSKKFFDLSIEEKMLAPHPPGHVVHRGYSWPGLEKVSNSMGDEEDVDGLAKKLREVGDVKKYILTASQPKESYEIGSDSYPSQPNVWPPSSLLPGFRTFMTDFYWLFHSNASMLLTALALGLDLPSDSFFTDLHSGHENQLRLLHYPPVPTSLLESGKATRLDAHSDWCSITLLLQDEIGGLEIADPQRPGAFIPAPPLENAIVLNIGDLMQRWSNDTFKSSLHRVTLPPPAPQAFISASADPTMTQARYSIPYFVGPYDKARIEVLRSCVDEERGRPRKYDPITWEDYRLMRGSVQIKSGGLESLRLDNDYLTYLVVAGSRGLGITLQPFRGIPTYLVERSPQQYRLSAGHESRLASPLKFSTMVLIRSARRTDTPSTATLSVAAFAHDELYCYLNPHKRRFPDHFRDYFLRRYKLRLADPTFHFLVAELEAGDEGYVREGGDGDNVVAYAIWTRKSLNPSLSLDGVAAIRRQTWAEWVEWMLLRANEAYIHAFRLDRALSYANFHRIMGPMAPSPFASDPYAPIPERWHLSNLAVAPAFQGRGIASRLMDWGLDIARREGVPVTLTASQKAEP